MKNLIPKEPTFLLQILLDASIEKAYQKKKQKKIKYITDVTVEMVKSVQSEIRQIIFTKINNVKKVTDSLLTTLEQNIDKLSPTEVLYFMDLIHKAQATWNLSDEEIKSIVNRLNNTSFPLD